MAKADATFITSTTDFHVKICSKHTAILFESFDNRRLTPT
jgi:hypothetical protein